MDITKCHLYAELSKLGLNSSKSVQDGRSLSDLDKYLHIPRPIESELHEKMEQIELSGGGIVLLVGSSGDGKSHLLSLMRSESKWEPKSFYNDATTSCSPNKTAVETLKEALDDFCDKKIKTTKRKLVLAINLGKLNAFVEDREVREYFSEIVNATKGIFDNNDAINEKETARIKLVLLFKEQMFEIYPQSNKDYPVEAQFLEAILEKIINKDEKNPFYKAFQIDRKNEDLPLNPILLNYQILQSSHVRNTIVKTIIEAIVRYKLIITPREFLDFIYSIMICREPHLYDEKRDFYNALLPTLLYSGGTNLILRAISRLDPILYSSTYHDNLLALLFTSIVIPQDKKNMLLDACIPENLLERVNVFYSNNGRDIEPTTRFIFRLLHIIDYHSESNVYKDFINYLAQVLDHQEEAYLHIYELVNRVIPRHFGSFFENTDMIPINIQGGEYKLFAKIDPKPQDIVTDFSPDHPSRFSLFFFLNWKIGNDIVELKFDYQLFEYLYDLNQGRLVTSFDNDRNLCFSDFVLKLAENANPDEIIVLKFDGTEKHLKEIFGKVRFS